MIPLSTPQLVVDGQWVSFIADWGDLKVRHRWPYGSWALEWKMALKPYQRPPALRVGALVQVKLGSRVLWAGHLARPDWVTGTMTAVGAARQGETTLCLTAAGETSSTPDAVIDQAIARGALSWSRLVSLSAAPMSTGDTTANLNYVTAILDAWSVAAGKRWAVDPMLRVYAAPDPTTPSIYARPGTGVLGVTEEQQAARVFGRYQNTSGALTTVTVGAGAPEVGVWLGSYGPISAARAVEIITGIRAQLQEATTWTNSITVTADQVTTPGGQRLGLDRVVAGRMLRLLGLRDERGAAASTDIVIGESEWNIAAGTVEVKPVGLSDRSLSGVVEAAGGVLL